MQRETLRHAAHYHESTLFLLVRRRRRAIGDRRHGCRYCSTTLSVVAHLTGKPMEINVMYVYGRAISSCPSIRNDFYRTRTRKFNSLLFQRSPSFS